MLDLDAQSRPRRRRLLVGLLVATGTAAVLAFALMWWGLGARAGDGLSVRDWRRLAGAATSAEAAVAAADPTGSGSAAGPTIGAANDEPPTAPVQDTRPDPPVLDSAIRAAQEVEYQARRTKTIVELQRFRVTTELPDGTAGRMTLINLSPRINHWYLLRLDRDAGGSTWYHLENLFPDEQAIEISDDLPTGVSITTQRTRHSCALWGDRAEVQLDEVSRVETGYAYLCGGRLAVRLRTTGRKSRMETVTDFLRDQLPGGERITVFVRENFFQDAYMKTSPMQVGPVVAAPAAVVGPPPARLDPRMAGATVTPAGLGLPLEDRDAALLDAGRWYPIRGSRGSYLSAVQPEAVAEYEVPVLRQRIGPLDEVEGRALVYLVAFDLARFDVAYALGTDHPRLGWSDRVPENLRPAGLPGPDGIGGAEPLVLTGMVPPHLLPRVAATFTGGFKRSHGAFLYGELAQANLGSHYGFVESGVVFSKLQPGLSTLLVTADGDLDMKTWSAEDDASVERLAFVRQNGVPIVQQGEGGAPEPGRDLLRFGAGNWSGSQEGRYRTLRASACLIEGESGRFLVYAYFSAATPSAMARVLLAYDCEYAMLLDMNALEHTYMATYAHAGGTVGVSHLIDEMRVLDRQEQQITLPRFLAFADNRDFFYLLRKPEPEAARAD